MAAIARGWLVVETAEGDRRTALLTAAQVERMLEGVGLPANMRHHEGDRSVTAGGARTRKLPREDTAPKDAPKGPKGERRRWRRLTDADRADILRMWDGGMRADEIAARVGCSEWTVRRVVRDRRDRP